MLKKLQLKSWLLMLCMLFGVTNAWADDVVYYTLTPAAGSNNGYANNCDVTISGITWNITGNSQMVPWRIGGKSLTGVDRTLYSKTAMGSAITKVVAQIGAASGITINSVKLTVASDANFSSQIDEVTIDGGNDGVAANSTLTFNPTSETSWAMGAYYMFTFNVTVSGTSNKFLEFGSATFYKEDDGVIVKTDPEVTLSPLTINVGEQATGEYPQELSDFEVESSDESIAEVVCVDGTITVNGKAAGTVTITTTWGETENYNGGEKTFEVTVKTPATVEDGVFDFTLGLDYGTGLTANNDGNSYITTDYTWTAGNVTLVTSGKYRWWSTDGTLRVFAPESGNTTLTLSVPEGKVITEIVITGGNNYMTLSPNVGTYSGGTWTGSAQSVVFSRGGQNAQIKTITVTYGEGTAKQDAELNFSTSAYTATIGEENTFPTLANPHSLSVTYSSSNEEVATVATDGTITLVAAGTTTIMASSAETETYNPGSASYTLTVENAPIPIDENVIEWDFTVNSWGIPEDSANKQTESASFSDGTHTIILAAADGYYFHTTGKYLLFGKSGSTLTFPAFEKDVEKIEVVGRTGASGSTKQNIFVGSTAVSTETTGATGTNTYEIAADYQAAGTIYTLQVTSNHNTQVTKIIIYLKDTVTPAKQQPGLAYDPTSITVNVGDDFTGATLSNPNDLTVTYESSNTAVATVAADGAVTLTGTAGTTTITASFAGNDSYYAGDASYTITVVDPNAPGSENNPYTVAQVLALFSDGNVPSTDVYVKGIISRITSLNPPTYTNARYYISDNGTENDEFYVYNGKYLDGADFTTTGDIQVGDEVVICGKLTTYSGTNEFAAGNYIVSLERPVVVVEKPVFSPVGGTFEEAQTVTITCASEGATIYYTTDGSEPTAQSTEYTEAITISETSTIKAIAIKGSDVSAIAEETYTIQAPSTIEEVRAQGTGSVFTKGVVTSVSGKNAYIQDATAAILVYSNSNITDLAVGDEIKVSGELTTYNGLLEIKNPTYTVVSQNNTVNPTVMTISEINAEDAPQSWLVRIVEATVSAINGLNVTLAQGENTVAVRFNATTDITFSVNDVVSLTGNIGCFNTVQIANPTDVTISQGLKGDVNGDGDISIADVTALVNIILGKATPETNPDYNFEAANVNGDEDISIADVTALVNIILGKTNQE